MKSDKNCIHCALVRAALKFIQERGDKFTDQDCFAVGQFAKDFLFGASDDGIEAFFKGMGAEQFVMHDGVETLQ